MMWNTAIEVIVVLSCISIIGGQVVGVPLVSNIFTKDTPSMVLQDYFIEQNVFVTLNAALSASISIVAPADTSECGKPINVTGSMQCLEEYRQFYDTARAIDKKRYSEYECQEIYQIVYECKEDGISTTSASNASVTEVSSDPKSLIDYNFDTVWAYKMENNNPVTITLEFPEAFQVNLVVMSLETIPIALDFYGSLNGDETRIARFPVVPEECPDVSVDPLCFPLDYFAPRRLVSAYLVDEEIEPLLRIDKLRIVIDGKTISQDYSINYLVIRDIYVSSTCACKSGNCSANIDPTSDSSKLAKYSCDCPSSIGGFLCDECATNSYNNSGECEDCSCGTGATNLSCNAAGACQCDSTLYDSNIPTNSKCDTPYITEISPLTGPVKGGTLVTIKGGLLSQLSFNHCTEVARLCTDCPTSDAELVCNIAAGNEPDTVSLVTALTSSSSGDNVTHNFTYIFSYEITDIEPREAFVSGGRILTITGNSLTLATSVKLVYEVSCEIRASSSLQWNVEQACTVLNDTIAVCSSKNFCEIRNQCPFKGIGVADYCDNKNVESLGATAESVSMKLTVNIDDVTEIVGNSDLPFKIIRDPIINEWENSLQMIAHDAEDFTVPGQYLKSGAIFSEYKIIIGGVSVHPLDINDTRLRVMWPHPRMPLGKTNVSVGNLVVEVGELKMKERDQRIPWEGIAAAIVVFVLLVIFVIVAIVIWKRKGRRAISQLNKNKLAYKPGNVRYVKRNGELGFISLSHLVSDNQLLEQLKPFLMDKERLSLSTQIGSGQFGKVFKGTIQFNDKRQITVAAKTLKLDSGVTEEIVSSFLAEATLMSNFNHANVLSLIGVVYGEGSMPVVVLPFMHYGDIRSLLHRDDEVFVLGDILHFAMQISRGMQYLSERRFIHRDLAARNCMVDSDYMVKIADFGLSHDIYEDDYYRTDETSSKPLPVKWMAVESLNTGKFTTHSDVWSYGVVMWELLTRGITPYPAVSNYEIKSYLKDGSRLSQPQYCPEFIYDMMCSCWQIEPTSRPTFAEMADKLSAILDESNYEERSKTKEIESDYYLQPLSHGDFNELYLTLVE